MKNQSIEELGAQKIELITLDFDYFKKFLNF